MTMDRRKFKGLKFFKKKYGSNFKFQNSNEDLYSMSQI